MEKGRGSEDAEEKGGKKSRLMRELRELNGIGVRLGPEVAVNKR